MTAYELRISDWSSDVCSSDLLTHEDEFTTFILNLCGLEPGLSKRELWRRVLLSFGSPFFHLRFLLSRISSCLLSRSTLHKVGRAPLRDRVGQYVSLSVVDVLLKNKKISINNARQFSL